MPKKDIGQDKAIVSVQHFYNIQFFHDNYGTTKVKIVDIYTDPQTTIPNNSVKYEKYCVRQDKTELACLMLHDSIRVYEFKLQKLQAQIYKNSKF